MLFTVCDLKKSQVSHAITVSRAPHLPYAITGVQLAIASSGTRPKSSSGGNINPFASEYNFFVSS